MRSFRSALVVVFLVLASLSFAKPPFLKVFMDTYKISPNSPLGKAKCLSCHLPPAPPKRNSYGLDVQAAMEKAHSRMLTAEILKAVEKKDSDGDGFSNLAEIRAGTLPDDKKSKPAKKVALGFEASALLVLAFIPAALVGFGRRSRQA